MGENSLTFMDSSMIFKKNISSSSGGVNDCELSNSSTAGILQYVLKSSMAFCCEAVNSITGRFKCIKKKQGLNRGIETSLSVGQKEIKSKCFYLLRFKT